MKQDKAGEALTRDTQEPAADRSSFLSRWSDRKIQAKEAKRSSRKTEESSVPDREPSDADMPPLESLDERSDYSGFLSAKVSPELRRLALRKLFHSPAFHVRDGLDDFDEDFTRFAELGDSVTQEMKHRLEVDAKRLARNLKDQTPEEFSKPDSSLQKAEVSASDHNSFQSAARVERNKPDRS